MRRRGPWIALVLVVGVLAVPPLLDRDRDSFPVSTYPMFATDRPRVQTLTFAAVEHPDGHVEHLSARLVTGTDEVVLAAETVRRAIGAGPEAAERLCRTIAERVAGAGRANAEDPGRGSLVVRVEADTFDTVAWFRGDHEPMRVDVAARCPVPS